MNFSWAGSDWSPRRLGGAGRGESKRVQKNQKGLEHLGRGVRDADIDEKLFSRVPDSLFLDLQDAQSFTSGISLGRNPEIERHSWGGGGVRRRARMFGRVSYAALAPSRTAGARVRWGLEAAPACSQPGGRQEIIFVPRIRGLWELTNTRFSLRESGSLGPSRTSGRDSSKERGLYERVYLNSRLNSDGRVVHPSGHSSHKIQGKM